MMQTGLPNAHLCRNVGIAKAIEAALLHEPLGDCENLIFHIHAPKYKLPTGRVSTQNSLIFSIFVKQL